MSPSAPTTSAQPRDVDVLVIGAGQAGLSAAYHLRRRGLRAYDDFVVLDANPQPGGAWQHRWRTLTMHDVHGVSALPGTEAPTPDDAARANAAVPAYFQSYEREFDLPIVRPVRVRLVEDSTDAAGRADGRLLVHTDDGVWRTRSLINATGTWDRPFIPHYPGVEEFTGRQLHTADYDGPEQFEGQHVVVVGGGHSAVQILGELAGHATTTWVTRQPPQWREGDFGPDEGRAAVALVEQRVRMGLLPQSVVSVTGLSLREQERHAAELGVYERHPMFERLTPTGARWADGREQQADAVLWATGFRPAVNHLAPLRLREPAGGIALDGTQAVRDPRVQLVGYGPSASTIGANRAGRVAARNATRVLNDQAA